MSKVLSGEWKFPSFSEKCPICGGKNCAVRIGFYYRFAYSFKEKRVIRIPIARYLCRRVKKVNEKSTHRTFSLLPIQLIPYKLYDIDTLLFIAVLKFISDLTILDIANKLHACNDPPVISVSVSTIMKYIMIFETAAVKFNKAYKIKSDRENQFLSYIQMPDIYSKIDNFYKKESSFLFGTPSQSRI